MAPVYTTILSSTTLSTTTESATAALYNKNSNNYVV